MEFFDFWPRNRPTAESHTQQRTTGTAFNSRPPDRYSTPDQHLTPEQLGLHSRVRAYLKEEELLYSYRSI